MLACVPDEIQVEMQWNAGRHSVAAQRARCPPKLRFRLMKLAGRRGQLQGQLGNPSSVMLGANASIAR